MDVVVGVYHVIVNLRACLMVFQLAYFCWSAVSVIIHFFIVSWVSDQPWLIDRGITQIADSHQRDVIFDCDFKWLYIQLLDQAVIIRYVISTRIQFNSFSNHLHFISLNLTLTSVRYCIFFFKCLNDFYRLIRVMRVISFKNWFIINIVCLRMNLFIGKIMYEF